MMEREYDLNKAINILKAQRIDIGHAVLLPDGSDFAMPVLGYLLTGAQLVQLMNENKLNAPNILEFAVNLEKDAQI
jgi:hypothetical protein